MDFLEHTKRLKAYYELRDDLNMKVAEEGFPYYSDSWLIIKFAFDSQIQRWYVRVSDSPSTMKRLDKIKASSFAIPEVLTDNLNKVWNNLLDEDSEESRQTSAYINERLSHLQYVEHALIKGQKLNVRRHRKAIKNILEGVAP